VRLEVVARLGRLVPRVRLAERVRGQRQAVDGRGLLRAELRRHRRL
jgi:hypothetical protein